MDKNQLIAAAVEAAGLSYSPYSQFPVGAAVLCEDGNIYTGTNVENASYGATVCAERVAVFGAVSKGQRRILAVAVAGGSRPIAPCGICRQVLMEFAAPETPLWLTDLTGNALLSFTLGELLPYSFSL